MSVAKHIHVGMDVRGALRNIGDLVGCVTDDAGRKLNRSEIFDWLCNELAKGRRVVPMGKACEGFDYQTGCPGHESSAESEGESR